MVRSQALLRRRRARMLGLTLLALLSTGCGLMFKARPYPKVAAPAQPAVVINPSTPGATDTTPDVNSVSSLPPPSSTQPVPPPTFISAQPDPGHVGLCAAAIQATSIGLQLGHLPPGSPRGVYSALLRQLASVGRQAALYASPDIAAGIAILADNALSSASQIDQQPDAQAIVTFKTFAANSVTPTGQVLTLITSYCPTVHQS